MSSVVASWRLPAVLVVVVAASILGVAVAMLLSNPGPGDGPGLEGNQPVAPSASVPESPAAATLVVDAADHASAAQAASRFLIEGLGGSTCQGGSGNEGVYLVDPAMFAAADSASDVNVWLSEDAVWLGDPSRMVEAIGATTIPGATAEGDIWVLLTDEDGQAYAQHLVRHVSPGGRDVWLTMSRIVSLDPSECR